MKNTLRLLFFSLFIIALALGTTNCKKKDPPPTQVTGVAKFPAGTSGDLSNAKVSLYLTYDDWLNNTPVRYTAVSGGGASVTFLMTDVNPGNYYLDVWKDIDNSGTWSTGDFVGWYGSGGLGSETLSPFQVVSEQTFDCTITMYVFAK
jgi:hypothetical protein